MPIGTTPLNDGHHIPNLAFGTGSVLKGKDVQDAVYAALHAGFRHVDTAQFYRNEESVGEGLSGWFGSKGEHCPGGLQQGAGQRTGILGGRRREDVWVTTKFGDSEKGPIGALKESLSELRLDHVDLYLIHAPWLIRGKVEAVWREMEQARESGLARSIGVSNFDAADLQELLQIAKIKPAVNQIRLHPYIYQTSLATLQCCKNNDIAVEAYGSLYPITQLPQGPVTPALKRPAERLGASLGQVLFLWVRAKKAVVVTTTNKEERLREYLGVGELGPLTEEEVRKIDDAAASFYPPIISHVKPPTRPLGFTEEKRTLRPQYTSALIEEHNGQKTRRVTRNFLPYAGVTLSMCALYQTTRRFGPESVAQAMAMLSIITDVICAVLWFRSLRKEGRVGIGETNEVAIRGDEKA